jgi:hypothetical protein
MYDLHSRREYSAQREKAMPDVYVYYFTERDEASGENMLSTRLATLETIKGRGEPVMESQIVVDATELDGDGFHNAAVGNALYGGSDLTAQIGSLELRAASRDSAALKLNEGSDGKDIYMLSLESRELRGEAKRLEVQRDDFLCGDPIAD